MMGYDGGDVLIMVVMTLVIVRVVVVMMMVMKMVVMMVTACFDCGDYDDDCSNDDGDYNDDHQAAPLTVLQLG